MKEFIIEVYGLANGALAPDNHKAGLSNALDRFEKVFNDKNIWKAFSEEKPICFESGDWDGLKSEPFLCKSKKSNNIFIGVAYEGTLDGSDFFDIYNNNSDSLIIDAGNNLEWRSLVI